MDRGSRNRRRALSGLAVGAMAIMCFVGRLVAWQTVVTSENLPSIREGQYSNLADLETSTGVKASISFNAEFNTPSQLDGMLTPPEFVEAGESAIDSALRFIVSNSRLFLLENPTAELRVSETRIDERGAPHVIFDRVHEGLTVLNNRVVVHFLPDGRIDGVSAGYIGSFVLDIEPSFSSDQAMDVAQSDIDAKLARESEAKLVIVSEGSEVRLAWMISAGTSDMPSITYLVDALSGDIIKKDTGIRP